MIDRDQPAVAGGTEPHPLPCLRAVADGGEHLRPGQHQLDRADPRPAPRARPGSRAARRGARRRTRLPGTERAPGRRSPADRTPPPGSCPPSRALAAVVHGQPVPLPAGHRGEQPHRIGGHRRGGEGLVVEPPRRRPARRRRHRDRRPVPTGFAVPAAGIRRSPVSGRSAVVDPDQRAAAVACSRVCATTTATCWPWCRIRLSLKGRGGRAERRHRASRECWRVLVRDHREDPRRRLRLRCRRCG